LPYRRALAPLILLLAPSLFGSDDFKVVAGTVEDQRYSDARLGGLTIELKLSGDSVKEVKALRARVKSAKDDLGSNLYKPDKNEKSADFEEFSPDRRPGPSLRLSSPSRDALTFDVAAELELFLPARDPDTKLKVDSFLSRLDKPISASALKAAKVEITPLSAAAYKTRQQGNRPKKEDIIAEAKKQGATDVEIKQALGLMDALSALGGEEPSETSVLLETKDPGGRVISIDVVGSDGSDLHPGSRGSQGDRESKLVKIDLSAKPPADAALVVTLRTSRSVVTVPLNLKGVALP